MNLKVWFKKEILGYKSLHMVGNLEMNCCCNDHLDHKECDDEKCHNGFDRQMKDLKTRDEKN